MIGFVNIGYGAVSEEEWLRLSLHREHPLGWLWNCLSLTSATKSLNARGLEHCGLRALLLLGDYGNIYSVRSGESSENVQGAGRQIAEQYHT